MGEVLAMRISPGKVDDIFKIGFGTSTRLHRYSILLKYEHYISM